LRDLTLADPDSVGLDPRVLAGSLPRLLERHRTRAAALVVRGQLVWERAWDGCDTSTRFDTFSIGKAFLAAAIGVLIGDGVIALDDPACRFLSEWSGDARRAITVRHLLTMTSGLLLDLPRFQDAPDANAATLSWPLVHRPGSHWSYEQVTAHALVPIVERASGQDPLAWLRDRVLDPIGARDVGWRRDEAGHVLGWRSVLASARDLARFGVLLLRRGRHEGRALIDPSFVDAMARVDPITCAAHADPHRDDFRRRSYGLLTYVNERGLWPGVDRSAFALLGSYGNVCLIDPLHDMVFVRLVTPEGREQPDGWYDDALFGNALGVTDLGTASMWRAVLAAFPPHDAGAKVRRAAVRAGLDVMGALRTRARRRGLSR
jgi:CubicO group peptidase (beta-lactamase class C family)